MDKDIKTAILSMTYRMLKDQMKITYYFINIGWTSIYFEVELCNLREKIIFDEINTINFFTKVAESDLEPNKKYTLGELICEEEFVHGNFDEIIFKGDCSALSRFVRIMCEKLKEKEENVCNGK